MIDCLGLCVCVHTHVCVCTHMCACACVFACMRVCVCACVRVRVCERERECVCEARSLARSLTLSLSLWHGRTCRQTSRSPRVRTQRLVNCPGGDSHNAHILFSVGSIVPYFLHVLCSILSFHMFYAVSIVPYLLFYVVSIVPYRR